MTKQAWLSSMMSIALLAGCEDSTAWNGSAKSASPSNPESPPPVLPPQPEPSPLRLAGRYALESPIDIPATVLAAGPAEDVLTILRQLHDDPAAALFSALDQAGVPLVDDLYGALPGALKDVVRTSINDFAKGRMQGDGGVGAGLDQILALANGALTRFTLKSILTVPAGAAEDKITASHAIDSLAFDIPGVPPLSVPREVLQKAMVMPGTLQTAPVLLSVAAGEGGDAMLTVGDHSFGLAYGEVVYSMLDGAGGGESLRSRLGNIFDCEGMGKYVSQRCVSVLCIGHAADITKICSQGLDEVVGEIHDQLSTLNFQALRFESGTAWLWDAPAGSTERDGQLCRLDHGTWKASIDVGTGARECKATFTGTQR